MMYLRLYCSPSACVCYSWFCIPRFNTTLTDLPVVNPLNFATAGCGIQNLVPGDPYYPYTKITPVFTGNELIASIANPPTPGLCDALAFICNACDWQVQR
jgi:hypothetical protein